MSRSVGYDFTVTAQSVTRRGNRHTGARAPFEAFFCAPFLFNGGRYEAGYTPDQSPSAGFPPSYRLPPIRGKMPAGSQARSLS